MRKRELFLCVCWICMAFFLISCGSSVEKQKQNNEVEQQGQLQDVSNILGKPDVTQTVTTKKNPWISEPDWIEKPTEPAKTFHGGELTGEEKKTGTTQGNMSSFGFVCEEDGFVYYSKVGVDDTLLCKESINGDESVKTVLADEEKMCFAINVMGDYVYYATGGMIKRVPKDGGETTVLSDIGANSIVVAEDKIYFTSDGVYAMNLDGSDRERLSTRGAVKGDAGLAAITVYRDYVLYVAERDELSLYAVKNDGTEEYLVQKGVPRPALVGDCIYYQLLDDFLEEMPEFDLQDKGRLVELSLLTGERRLVSKEYAALTGGIGEKLYYSDYHIIQSISFIDGTEEVLYPVAKEASGQILDFLYTGKNRVYFSENGLKYVDVETGELGSLN